MALKIIKSEMLDSEDRRQRFLLEARATASFNHPHIVTIHAVGEFRGSPYVALEYLEGQSLLQRLQQARLSIPEVIRTGLAIARALQAAHQNSILHRDLKPGNVMLTRDGRLRVVDFGLAKAIDQQDTLQHHALDETLDPSAREGPDQLAHLQLFGRKLHAVSELGIHLEWDLAPFYLDRCQLLRQVWNGVPVVWEEGKPRVRPPLPGHPCLKEN